MSNFFLLSKHSGLLSEILVPHVTNRISIVEEKTNKTNPYKSFSDLKSRGRGEGGVKGKT